MTARDTRTDWDALLARTGFIELGARARATALLDTGTARELCGPFDRIESPWLEPQGVVPESDDGVVVVKGGLGGRPAVVIGIEQAFQGGGIGEVSGTKIAATLSLAAADNRDGTPTVAILLLETGVYACRRPIWAWPRPRRCAPRCWSCAPSSPSSASSPERWAASAA